MLLDVLSETIVPRLRGCRAERPDASATATLPTG